MNSTQQPDGAYPMLAKTLHTQYVALRSKAAIADQFTEKEGKRQRQYTLL